MAQGAKQVTLSVRVEPDVASAVDAFGDANGCRNRTDALRLLLSTGLGASQARALNGKALSPPPVVGEPVPHAPQVQELLERVEMQLRTHARASHQAAKAVMGVLLSDASDEQRVAARQFLEAAFAEFEPLEGN